ncbi:MAG TPA: TonB family protein [Devosia sp.]|nr:TonB family protein [Devosia sp.]
MHYALPGSVLVHALALGAGLLMFAAPEANDAPSMQSVSVEVISIASVSANQASTIESDATETLVSAGAEVLPPTASETIAATPPDLVEPIAPTEITPAEPVETVTPEPERLEVAVLSALSAAPLEAEAVAPITPATLQPAEITDADIAPTPHLLTRPRPSAPTQRPRQQQVQPRPAAPAGNGGQNQADSVAAKPSGGQQGHSGSGGDAETARYPSQIIAKLRRALRYPGGAGGASGEVQVQFTVSAGGQPSGLRIVKSSGNAAIDQAGMDTVVRAAPFPPIPAGANRDSWGFTVPLAFVRG